MRLATIDIGTNTVLLLVAKTRARGVISALDERATITRLGEDVDRTRRLKPEAVERTRACLDVYARVVENFHVRRVAVVGTSAMRDASGGEEIRAFVRNRFGVEAQTISGDEEASLMFRGALNGLTVGVNESMALFDIGGGSTEIVIGEHGSQPPVTFSRSYDVGSVRLTERHVRHDPPSSAEIDCILGEARRAFADVPSLPKGTAAVGIAGTMTTLASVGLGLAQYDATRVHGSVLSRADVDRFVRRLSTLPLEQRRAVPGIAPKRADVIVAGALVAVALLDHWGVNQVRISDRGVRWGLAEDLSRSEPLYWRPPKSRPRQSST